MRILVAEDEKNVAYALRALLESAGWSVEIAENGRAALDRFLAERHDVVLTDLSMPLMDGMELLRAVRAASAHTPVILITARGNERVAIDAVRAGAWDYFRKPFENAEVTASVRRASELVRLRNENAALRKADEVPLLFDPERSPAMRQLAQTIERVAAKDVTVLITGETGTGKEVVAQQIHALSPRRTAPFIAINCGALTETLVEAELFGWEKGSFTGAVGARPGYFEQAHGGTLLLDEIGEMPLGLQAKLLRVLQEGEVQRIGATKPRKVDVRLVAATNRNLQESITKGSFREDLFYRLNVVQLALPPLRERPDDIALLARHFAARFGAKFETGPVQIEEAALADLQSRPWRGNVRELTHVIERAVALSADAILRRADIEASEPPTAGAGSLTDQVEAFERGILARALQEHQDNQSATARALGIARVTLIDKMKKYRLKS